MKIRKRISRVFYYEGLSLGLLLSSVAFAIFEIAGRLARSESFLDSPWLIVCPAFAAAYVGIRAVAEQSHLAQDIEIEKTKRLERGARAELPLAISQIKSLCDQAVLWHFNNATDFPAWDEFDALLYKLRSTIEHSDETNAEYLLMIIRHYQVLYARGRSQNSESRSEAISDRNGISSVEHWYSAMNWAALAAMIENVFNYARGSCEIIDTSAATFRVRSQFFNVIPDLEEYRALNDAVSIREERGSFQMNF